MRWIEVAIPTKSEEIDSLCAKLESLGVEGLTIEDERDFHDFLENNRQYWDYVDDELSDKFENLSQIKFYFEDNEEGQRRVTEISAALGIEPKLSYMQDSDWENNWKEFYKPFPVGDNLMIVPEWENPELGGRKALRLEPGLTFGTGTHATTRMCLEVADGIDMTGKRILDLGCGSGILGIGAAVLGAESVVGCDIDPKCPDVAGANAAMNGIGEDRFKVYAGDILSDEGMRRFLGTGYDIVFANIVADVIIPLSAIVRRFMGEGALFICSGIIDGRQDEVAAALQANSLKIKEHICEDGEWHCFVCI